MGNYGIYAGNGKGVRVIDVRVASTMYAGIHITAGTSKVVGCQVVDPMHFGIAAYGEGTLVSDCVVSGAIHSGVSVGKGGLVVRSVARNCVNGNSGVGFNLTYGATAIDCMASGSATGFYMTSGCALRGIESVNNGLGVWAGGITTVITGSRIMNNTNMNTYDTFTNGGGNVIQ